MPVATVTAAPRQKVEGFGASGAWWPIDLIKYPASRAAASRHATLRATDGIALSGYRYNIGGGGKGVTNPARAPKQFPDDVAGRTFLKMAADADVPVLTAFVNSAPPQFTTNGKTCGGSLKPGSEAAFAAYLANIVKTLHDQDHVTINYVSPMNEPDDSFPDCGQEGMSVPVAQRAPFVKAVAAALANTAPYAKVIADETTADAILANEAPQWLAGASASMAAIAHHTYDFPNDQLRRNLPPLSKKFGLPTWMTEICCYKGSGGVASSMGANYDPTMTQGLWLANQIYDDMTVAGDSAWYWWTALSSVLGCDVAADSTCPRKPNTKGFNDGLLYYDAKRSHRCAVPDEAAFGARSVRALRVAGRAFVTTLTGAPAGVRLMAFQDGNAWTVVAWNNGKNAAPLAIALPRGGTPVRPQRTILTDAQTRWR